MDDNWEELNKHYIGYFKETITEEEFNKLEDVYESYGKKIKKIIHDNNIFYLYNSWIVNGSGSTVALFTGENYENIELSNNKSYTHSISEKTGNSEIYKKGGIEGEFRIWHNINDLEDVIKTYE